MLQQLLGAIVIAGLAGCSEIAETPRKNDTLTSAFDTSVVVSTESVDSDDPYDIVYSNIIFLNALLEEHFSHHQLSPDALRSYYVDYYLAQVNNGGLSQFVYNSRWEDNTVRYVREGLRAMGAVKHLDLFERNAAIVDRILTESLQTFLGSEYFGENKERDVLDANNDEFYELSKREDLIRLNAGWLRSLPSLVVKTPDEMKAEVERRSAGLPDREERSKAALLSEPRYMKLIRVLCVQAGQELSRVTAGDPTHSHNGRPTLAWHFITDEGHHYMVDADGKAMMFRGGSHEQIAEIEAPEE